jgi:AcrR family transcriptional regulator
MPRPPKVSTEAILEAARQVFLEQGVGASTLAIAERIGISEAAIFKRFVTKQALFLAAMGFSQNPPWVKVLTQKTPTTNLKQELMEICQQMLAFYQEVLPQVIMMMQKGHLAQPPMPPPPVRDSQLLAAYLDRAIAHGVLKPCNTNAIAHMIVGGINNYAMTQTVRHQHPEDLDSTLPPSAPDELIEAMIESLWHGIDR